MTVTLKHVSVPTLLGVAKAYFPYTDVCIEDLGRHYYSRLEGHQMLGTAGENLQKELFLRRQRPGYYRVEG